MSSFSKKNPMKIRFVEKKNSSEIIKSAYKKIAKYKSILSSDEDIEESLKKELVFCIAKCRGQIKFSSMNNRKVILSYKGVDVEVPLNKYGYISTKNFILAKSKVQDTLRQRRREFRKRYSEVRSIENAQYNIVGGVHLQKNSIAELFQTVAKKRVNSLRKPKANENHVGMEIEFYSSYDRDSIAQRLIDAKLSQNARIMTDRTIRGTEDKEYGFELCLVAPESQFQDILQRACDVLSDLRAETNQSCGFHVHLDARNRNKELLFWNLVQCQDLFFKMTYGHRKSNNYCRPQNTPEWKEANREHYDAISRTSYDKHQTIEVRTHHGTTDFSEIKNWVNFLVKIANYNERLDREDRVTPLVRKLEIKEDLKRCLLDKVRMFSAS